MNYVLAHVLLILLVGGLEVALFRLFKLFYPVAFLKKFFLKKRRRTSLKKPA